MIENVPTIKPNKQKLIDNIIFFHQIKQNRTTMFSIAIANTMSYIILLLVFNITISMTNLKTVNSHNSMDRTMQCVRNKYYRIRVWKKSKSRMMTKRLFTRIDEMREKIRMGIIRAYDSAIFTYCDTHVSYYGFSQETREIIEHIISLYF